jgi:hypothetical protein
MHFARPHLSTISGINLIIWFVLISSVGRLEHVLLPHRLWSVPAPPALGAVHLLDQVSDNT